MGKFRGEVKVYAQARYLAFIIPVSICVIVRMNSRDVVQWRKAGDIPSQGSHLARQNYAFDNPINS